jgi:DNA-directed RNA polymerase subunit RPC12/RpoP
MLNRRCTYCGSHEHPIELCPKTWDGNTKRTVGLHCAYCGSKKHDIAHCPKTYLGNINRRNNRNGLYLD